MTKQQPLYDRVAIIGGGPTGLAAVKALALEPVKFSKIDLFERRDRLGGLWYHQGDKSLVSPQIPNTSPSAQEIVSDKATTQDRYFSAIYEFMETNVDHRMMQYQGVEFLLILENIHQGQKFSIMLICMLIRSQRILPTYI